MDELKPAIAIVDDDDMVRRALCRLVASLSYRPLSFASGETFLKAVEHTVPFCVLVDLHMPGIDGLDLLRELGTRGISLAAIVITGSEDQRTRERCLKAGAAAFLNKPLSRETLSAAIEAVARR